MAGGVVTTVIGDIAHRVSAPPAEPPPPIQPPPSTRPPIGPGKPRGRKSLFENAIKALDPVHWYRFRDGNFNSNIKDRTSNNDHLVKQVAAATRSTVPTRTTHPGGAYFPSVANDDLGSQSTLYKTASNITAFNSAEEYTLIVSARFITPQPQGVCTVFGIADDTASEGGGNDLLWMTDTESTHTTDQNATFKHRDSAANERETPTTQTETVHDGVNRLYIVRFDEGTLHRLTTSKPGHELLVESTETNANALSTDTLSAILNDPAGLTGSQVTSGFVIDQIALFDLDIGASAEADLHSKWMTEVSGAGYYPSMMQFDGSTGYYGALNSFTTSGNKVTAVLRFNRAEFSGAAGEVPFLCIGPSNHPRVQLVAFPNDIVGSENVLRVRVSNSAGTVICELYSQSELMDGEDHILFFAFDGDAGTAVFRVDGANEDDTGHGSRVAPTTGTLDSGASSEAAVGSGSGGAASSVFGGQVGHCGIRDAYLTNYADFSNADDNSLPAPIDEKNWSEWDGRTAGDPGMTEFDGSTGYYSHTTATTSGNTWTAIARFNSTESSQQRIQECNNGTAIRMALTLEADGTIQAFAKDSTNATILLRIYTAGTYDDGDDHIVLAKYDSTNGTASLVVDGVSDLNTGHASHILLTGTLPSGPNNHWIGTNSSNVIPFNGSIGFAGFDDGTTLTAASAMDDSTPLDIDEANWTEWGGQPLFWNRTGEMSDNKGSAGNMTINGTIKPPRPAFWSHTGQMDNNKGSAGDMTENGTITMTEGGSP